MDKEASLKASKQITVQKLPLPTEYSLLTSDMFYQSLRVLWPISYRQQHLRHTV